MPEQTITDSRTALAHTWVAPLVHDEAHFTSPRATLRPPDEPPDETLDETVLPPLKLKPPGAELELRGELGVGGMAVVERAFQRSLDREVAVKRALDRHPRKRSAMVREARIAGGLEHPNIIPIHALGHDEAGDVVIVMKRVSGASWHDLLEDPEHELWGDGDRLLRNLEILTAVCRALELSHSRGWLHRDLKADNVMIGEFGEVYVLDWGIAVPLAVGERGEAIFGGTPAYMAPEMAAAGVLTERTDVFLLGGMLHEVVSRETPNQGATLGAILDAALTPRIRRYPDDVPAELVAVTRRATSYHPEDRFEDVAALRRALASFVVHRGAHEITEGALLSLEDGGRAELIEARSGFRQSLALWPANRRAVEGLSRCLYALAELELRDDNPASAMDWASQLEVRDPELEERINTLRDELAQTAKELEALRGFAADRDVAAWWGARRARLIVYGIALAALGIGGGMGLRAGWYELGYAELGAIFTLGASVGIIITLTGRRRENLISRWVAWIAVGASLTPFPILLVAWRLDLPAEAALPLDLLTKAGGAVVMGIVVRREFFWTALIAALTATTLLAFPGTYPVEIACGGLGLALLAIVAGLPGGGAPSERA